MRQAGVIAAPGIFALKNMVSPAAGGTMTTPVTWPRACPGMKGVDIDMASVQTNIVIADISGTGLTSDEYVERCKKAGILIFSFGPTTVRFVTHYGIVRKDMEEDDGPPGTHALISLFRWRRR